MEENNSTNNNYYREYFSLFKQGVLLNYISDFFFILVNTVIFVVIALCKTEQIVYYFFGKFFISIIGMSLCLYWIQVIKEVRRVNEIRFRIAMKYETSFNNSSLLRDEWNMLGDIPHRREVINHLPIRRFLPILFFLGYTLSVYLQIFELFRK